MKKFASEARQRAAEIKSRYDHAAKDTAANVGYRREAREQAAQQRLEAAQKKRAEKQSLANFAGKLVLITNPSPVNGVGREFEAYKQRIYYGLANTIDSTLPDGIVLGMSVHMQMSRVRQGGYYAMSEVASALESRLTQKGHVVHNYESRSNTAGQVGLYVSETTFDVERIRAALDRTERVTDAMECPKNLGHIAIVSALGIENVDLDYSESAHGNGYLLQGMNEKNGQLVWDKIHDARNRYIAP